MNATPPCYIRIDPDDFDVQAEYQALCDQGHSGAVVTFTGLVRDLEGAAPVSLLELQHYPGMTERVLHDIASAAMERWALGGVRIIHRVGPLQPSEQIVFVGVASQHRTAAFQACEYLMDCLKTQAPFWKKIQTADGSAHWVDFKDSDAEAARRWLRGDGPEASPQTPRSENDPPV